MYAEDELLMLSGIQHFYFCQRQWALIHLEQQWAENDLTYGGDKVHEKVDDPFFFESRGDLKISRSVPVVSYELGLNGIADVVEFHRDKEGVQLDGSTGFWRPNLVEYKHGKPKKDSCDEVQLCAQAICLEEMFQMAIKQGDLYYWKPRKRDTVIFHQELREKTKETARKMHEYFEKGMTAAPVYESRCDRCSLKSLCLPQMDTKPGHVRRYLKQSLDSLQEETQ